MLGCQLDVFMPNTLSLLQITSSRRSGCSWIGTAAAQQGAPGTNGDCRSGWALGLPTAQPPLPKSHLCLTVPYPLSHFFEHTTPRPPTMTPAKAQWWGCVMDFPQPDNRIAGSEVDWPLVH